MFPSRYRCSWAAGYLTAEAAPALSIPASQPDTFGASEGSRLTLLLDTAAGHLLLETGRCPGAPSNSLLLEGSDPTACVLQTGTAEHWGLRSSHIPTCLVGFIQHFLGLI